MPNKNKLKKCPGCGRDEMKITRAGTQTNFAFRPFHPSRPSTSDPTTEAIPQPFLFRVQCWGPDCGVCGPMRDGEGECVVAWDKLASIPERAVNIAMQKACEIICLGCRDGNKSELLSWGADGFLPPTKEFGEWIHRGSDDKRWYFCKGGNVKDAILGRKKREAKQ